MPLLILLPLLGCMLAWQSWQKVSFSSAALHSTAALLVMLYVGALLDLLSITALLILLTGSGLLVYWLLANKRNLQTLLNIPLLLFVGSCILYWYVHGQGNYLFYDEFAHWGVYVRELLATGSLWDGDTNAMHPRYPPGPALWQYLFSSYTYEADGVMYFAQFVLLVVPLLVVWEGLSVRQALWPSLILAFVAWLLVSLGHGIASLHVDHVLSTWFAGILLGFMRETGKRNPIQLLSYCLPLLGLTLLKDVGLLLALLGAGCMGLQLLYQGRAVQHFSWRDSLAIAAPLVTLACAAALITTFTWSKNRNAVDAPIDVQSAGLVAVGIAQGISRFKPVELTELRRRFAEVFVNQQISKAEISRQHKEFDYDIMSVYTEQARLSTFGFIVVCLLIQLLAWILLGPAARARWLLLFVGINLSAIVYLVTLFFSYQFAFGLDGMRLPSYVRYAHTILLSLVLVSVAPFLPAFYAGEGLRPQLAIVAGRACGAIFVGILICAYLFEPPFLQPLYTPSGKMDVRTQLQGKVEALRSLPGDARIWVHLPVPESLEIYARIYRLELSPVPTTVVVGPDYLNQSGALLQAVWADYDYVWFPLPDEAADKRRVELLGEFNGERLFRVDKVDQKLNLTPVDPWSDRVY